MFGFMGLDVHIRIPPPMALIALFVDGYRRGDQSGLDGSRRLRVGDCTT